MKENTMKLREIAESTVAEMNEAIEKDSFKAIGKAKAAMQEAIENLNAAVIAEAFDEFLSDGAENAMRKALVAGYVTIFATKNERNKVTGAETVVLSQKENNVVDIVALEQYCKKGNIFHNGQWIYWVEKFTQAMTAKAIKDMGTAEEKARFAEKYPLSDAARKCDMGKDPTSLKSLTKALQAIWDGILFEELEAKQDEAENATEKPKLNRHKVTSRDVNYLLYLAFKRGKGKLSIAVPQQRTMIPLITETMHREITNGEYKFEYNVK